MIAGFVVMGEVIFADDHATGRLPGVGRARLRNSVEMRERVVVMATGKSAHLRRIRITRPAATPRLGVPLEGDQAKRRTAGPPDRILVDWPTDLLVAKRPLGTIDLVRGQASGVEVKAAELENAAQSLPRVR